MSIGSILLLVLLVIATVTDVREHKIFNWTTYPGMVLGLVSRLFEGGWLGLQDSVSGFLFCGIIMVVCFVLFNIGGGDVKLIAMMGAFLGVHDGVEALLWTFILGSVMGLGILIWRFGLLHILKKTWEHIRVVFRARGWIPPTEEEREPLKRWLFLAPSALAATGLILAKPWLRDWGLYL